MASGYLNDEVEYLMGVHEFTARSDDEISVRKGDRIEVIENDREYGDGWYIGKNLRTKQTGLFPKVFTTELLIKNTANVGGGPNGNARTSTGSNRGPGKNSLSYNSQETTNSGSSGGASGPSVHDTISDIDEAISELQSRGIDSITTPTAPQNTHVSDNVRNSHSTHQPTYDSGVDNLPSLDNIPNWSPYDIQQYFSYRGYEHDVCNQFIHHKITGSILLELDLAYLKEIDIASFGTRFEISKDIKYLNSLVAAQLSGESASIAAATAAIRRSSKTKSSHSHDRTSSSSKGLMLPPQTSPKKSDRISQMTSPIGPRTSSLRSSLSNSDDAVFSAIGSPYHGKNRSNDSSIIRKPSFNKNWTHPGFETTSPQTPELSLGGNSALFGGNIGLLSPNSLNEYNETVAVAGPVPRTPQSSVLTSRRRSYTIDALTNSRFDGVIADQEHIRNPSGDTLRDRAKDKYRSHSRSTSSLQVGDKNDDISMSAEEARKSHRRHSSIMSFMTTQNLASTLATPVESISEPSNTDLLSYTSSSREDVGAESESGSSSIGVNSPVDNSGSTAKKYLDLLPGRQNSNVATTASPTKRISTDPLQSKTTGEVAPPPSPKRSATFSKPKVLRSMSSQHNLKKITKQKTSAFMEGIRQITAEEASKTASFSGWMHKRGGVGVGTWKSRYFTLHGTRLSYFTSHNDTKERGLIDITAHRVLPARENEDKLISLYAASVGAGRHCFKLIPPAPGFKKGVTFTAPKVHYFAVETKEEMRTWMASLMKATIDRDDSVPVISSCATPTVPLPRAQELFAEARARDEDLRARMIAGGLASNANSANNSTNKVSTNNSSSTNETYPTTPDSPTGSSLQSSRTASSANSSSLKLSSPKSFNPAAAFGDYQPSDIRHLTTKTAGLQIVTNLEDS